MIMGKLAETYIETTNSHFINTLLCTVPLSLKNGRFRIANNLFGGMVHNYLLTQPLIEVIIVQCHKHKKRINRG